MRRLTSLTLAVVALAAVATVGGPAAGGVAADAEPAMVSVGDARLWPYVAPDRSFDRPASSVNVVVQTDPTSVRRYLARERAWNRSDEEWVEASPNDTAVVADETVPWRDAPGATRYVYVAESGWIAERYQLHRGEYFGSRDHLRAYGPPGSDWTAIQAHAEHWDWFTITHTVDSVENAQRRVEAAFLGRPAFEVRRVYHANGETHDADGWTTVVALAVTPLLARRGLGRLRRLTGGRNRRRLGLAGTLATLPLLVRFGGVGFERHLPWLSPDAVVAVWYPVLVVGVPVAAYALGRRLPATEAGGLAGAGLGLGFLLDYAYLGVTVLPIPIGAHRTAAVAAAALVAAGARSDFRWTPPLRAGVALWVAVVLAGHVV